MIKKLAYNHENLVNLLILSTLPVFLTIVLGAIISTFCSSFFNSIHLTNIIVIWISMLIAMCIVPIAFLKKNDKDFKIKEIGFREIQKKDIILIISVAVWFFIGCYKVERIQLYDLFQNLPISFAEEFWCKAILFYQLKKIFSKKSLVISLSAVVFAFVTHMNGDPLANLLIRMPMGILTGMIYEKDKSLVLPITIHFVYNTIIV